MSRGVRKSGGMKKKFLWKRNLKRGVPVMERFGH